MFATRRVAPGLIDETAQVKGSWLWMVRPGPLNAAENHFIKLPRLGPVHVTECAPGQPQRRQSASPQTIPVAAATLRPHGQVPTYRVSGSAAL